MAADSILLGFDVGTTAAKGGAFDEEGNFVALGEAHYAIDRPRPGHAEQDPQAWWEAVLQVLDQLGATVDLARVRAVGVCSQVNTHVFVDESGDLVGPAIVWQDQRCAEIAARVDGSLSDEDRRRIWDGGFKVDASFLLCRSLWVEEQHADDWARVRWVLSPKDFLNFRLSGEIATDVISPIGLVDADHRYNESAFELAPASRSRMPPLRPFTDAVGTVQAKETGLPADAAVVVATMDAWANLYGSGATRPGQAMEVAGTSEIIGLLSDRRRPTAGVVSFLPVDGLYLHAGPTQAGGDALRWFAEVSGLSIEEALLEAERSEPGSLGLVFLPHLMGERAPLWNSDARGVFFGLSSDQRRGEIARSVLEGVAYSARHLLEEVEAAAERPAAALRTSGGGARSDLWCQIKADVLDRPLERVAVLQSGVLGASLMAGVGAGVFENLAEAADRMVHVERRFDPDPDRTVLYDELYRIYRDLYPRLLPSYSDLRAVRDAWLVRPATEAKERR
jgi:xylulokinase